jgi:putative transposase
MSLPTNMHALDLSAEVDISQRHLPHWFQRGAATFITFRTMDSMPQSVLARWEQQQACFLKWHNAAGKSLQTLQEPLKSAFKRFRHSSFHKHLDKGHGECPLGEKKAAQIVSERLLQFDGSRYVIDRFVIMPNHVHVLAAFGDRCEMRRECENWLHYTAFRINQLRGRIGPLWQAEPFDHCIRTIEQLEWVRTYIKRNPHVARLRASEFAYWQATES